MERVQNGTEGRKRGYELRQERKGMIVWAWGMGKEKEKEKKR